MTRKRFGSFPMIFKEFEDFMDKEKFFDVDLYRKDWIPVPAVNVRETDDSYEVEVTAPGMAKSDFDISIDGNLLSVKAEREEKKEEKDDNYFRKEFSYQSFNRTVTLPENTNDESVKATYENGVLNISVGKKIGTKVNNGKSVTVE